MYSRKPFNEVSQNKKSNKKKIVSGKQHYKSPLPQQNQGRVCKTSVLQTIQSPNSDFNKLVGFRKQISSINQESQPVSSLSLGVDVPGYAINIEENSTIQADRFTKSALQPQVDERNLSRLKAKIQNMEVSYKNLNFILKKKMIKNQEFLPRHNSKQSILRTGRRDGENSAPCIEQQQSFNRNFHDAVINQPSYTLDQSNMESQMGSSHNLNEDSYVKVNEIHINEFPGSNNNYSRIYNYQNTQSDQNPSQIANFGSHKNIRDSRQSIRRETNSSIGQSFFNQNCSSNKEIISKQPINKFKQKLDQMKESLRHIDNNRYTPLKKKKESYSEFSAKKLGLKVDSPFSQTTDNLINGQATSSFNFLPSQQSSSNIKNNIFTQNTVPLRNQSNSLMQENTMNSMGTPVKKSVRIDETQNSKEHRASIFSQDYSPSSNGKGILKQRKSNSDLFGVGSFYEQPVTQDQKQSRQSLLRQNSQSIRKQKISGKKTRHYQKHKGYDRPINAVPIDEIPSKYQSSYTYTNKYHYPESRKTFIADRNQARCNWVENQSPNLDLEREVSFIQPLRERSGARSCQRTPSRTSTMKWNENSDVKMRSRSREQSKTKTRQIPLESNDKSKACFKNKSKGSFGSKKSLGVSKTSLFTKKSGNKSKTSLLNICTKRSEKGKSKTSIVSKSKTSLVSKKQSLNKKSSFKSSVLKKSILKTPSVIDSARTKSRTRNASKSQNIVNKSTGLKFRNMRAEIQNSYSPKILSRGSQNFDRSTTPVKIEQQFSLAKQSNLSASQSVRSISQEYLARTNKKNFVIDDINPSFLDHQILSISKGETPKKQDDVLKHVLKQINSLKIENLELKKMVLNQTRSRSQGSNRQSVNFTGVQSLESIKSVKQKKTKKTSQDVSKRQSFMKFKSVGKKVKKGNKKNQELMLNQLDKSKSKVRRMSIKRVQTESFSQCSDKSLFMDKSIRLSFGKRQQIEKSKPIWNIQGKKVTKLIGEHLQSKKLNSNDPTTIVAPKRKNSVSKNSRNGWLYKQKSVAY